MNDALEALVAWWPATTVPAPSEVDWILTGGGGRGSGAGGPFAAIAAAALAATVAAVVAWLVTWMLRRDRARHGPAFRRFAAALGLGFRQRGLLVRLARRAGMPHPASLLISRGCFEAAVARSPEAAEVAALRRRIFAGLP